MPREPRTVGLWKSVRCFLRVEYLPFAFLMPVLGAASVDAALDAEHLLVLAVAALCFHLWSMLVNDVVDLPVDRQQPGRRSYPLVRGVISPAQVLAVAGLQIPAMAALLWWRDAGPWAWGGAGGAFAIMLVYNLWSKTSPVPPLMDLAQALPFGLMVLVGAALVAPDGSPTGTTAAVVLWVTTWESLTNVFGGLRDLEFDARMDLRTTPRMLGARVVEGHVEIPARLRATVYATLCVLPSLTMLVLWTGGDARWAPIQAGIALALHACAGVLAWTAWQAGAHGCREMTRIVVFHLSISLLPIVVVLATREVGWLLLLLGGAFMLPTVRFAGRPLRYWGRARVDVPDVP